MCRLQRWSCCVLVAPRPSCAAVAQRDIEQGQRRRCHLLGTLSVARCWHLGCSWTAIARRQHHVIGHWLCGCAGVQATSVTAWSYAGRGQEFSGGSGNWTDDCSGTPLSCRPNRHRDVSTQQNSWAKELLTEHWQSFRCKLCQWCDHAVISCDLERHLVVTLPTVLIFQKKIPKIVLFVFTSPFFCLIKLFKGKYQKYFIVFRIFLLLLYLSIVFMRSILLLLYQLLSVFKRKCLIKFFTYHTPFLYLTQL